MSGDESGSRASQSVLWATLEQLSAANRPVFWGAAASVFLTNAVLSIATSDWALAALQAGTGLLAIVSAVTSRKAPHTQSDTAHDGDSTPTPRPGRNRQPGA